MDVLFREIILGDLGGFLAFTSSVYIVDVENHVILHLYDDRGLDIVAYEKNTLSPLYKNLNEWTDEDDSLDLNCRISSFILIKDMISSNCFKK